MTNKVQSALVLGLGVSGLWAAKLLLRAESLVCVIDSGEGQALETRREELVSLGAEVVLGSDNMPFGDVDLCVVSPGIDSSHPWIAGLSEKGVEIISELELGARHCKVPILAITGTNGKSTVTKLCTDALGDLALRAAAGGNYGTPLCQIVCEDEDLDWVVAEVSSFQLEWARTFCPTVGVLLNVQPDHLNRHGDMTQYRAMKARLFKNIEGIGVVPETMLEDVRELCPRPSRWLTFGSSGEADFLYESGCVHEKAATMGDRASYTVKDTVFDNPVMGLSAAAALAAFRAAGVDPEGVVAAAKRFRRLPHRMEEVREFWGVRFVDDSKATNLAALSAALEMTGPGVRLIAGGQLKEGELNSVKEVLVKHVRKAYLIGEAAPEIESAWGAFLDTCQCDILERAVHLAWAEASAGETVLLSPGCASFDQFMNYKERGEQFASIVRSVNEEDMK